MSGTTSRAALCAYIQSPRRNIYRLVKLAEVDRVANGGRPYLEVLA